MDDNIYTAQDLLTADVVTVPPGMPVTSVARMFADRGISSAPVLDDHGRLVGVVTEADLLRRLASEEDAPTGWLRGLLQQPDRQAGQYARTHGLTAQDIMTRDLITVEPDATAAHCAHLMEQHGIKRLPVVVQGHLVGIVSRADLLRAVMEPALKIGVETAAQDKRIRAALRTEMHAQPWANSITTFADVEDGVVTLHGYVGSDTVRRGLHVLVERIEGVERLDDQMIDRMLDPQMLPAAGLAYGANFGRSVIL